MFDQQDRNAEMPNQIPKRIGNGNATVKQQTQQPLHSAEVLIIIIEPQSYPQLKNNCMLRTHMILVSISK